MDWLREQVRKNVKLLALTRDEEGVEEFRVSLLLHVGLLLFMTLWYAWRVVPGLEPKTITTVRLVGPMLLAQAGSGETPAPISASTMKSGTSRHLSAGLSGPNRVNNQMRRPGPNAGKVQKVSKPQPRGESARPGKPLIARDDVKTSVIQDGLLTNRPAKPYVSRLDQEEISPFSVEPSMSRQFAPVMPGNDLGEPMAAETTGDESTGPIESGSSNDRSLPSGNPDADGEKGGGSVEVAGVEALGGGSESFVAPRIVSQVLPEYTEWARKKGVKGQVVYKVLIQAAGTVGEVAPLSATVDSRLTVIGAQALRRWVFTPVLVGGEPCETWVRITMQFHLS